MGRHAAIHTQVGLQNVVAGINMPDPSGFNNQTFKSLHAGGALFAVADGSVRFVAETIDFAVYRALASRNGREAISMP